MNIKSISCDKRPREKAILYGFHSLNDYEVLAIIIGSGTKRFNAIEISKKLIDEFYTLNNLSLATFNEISKLDGLGKTKSLKICAVFELFKRVKMEKNFLYGICISNIGDFDRFVSPILRLDNEEFLYVFILDASLKIMKIHKFKGSDTLVIVDQNEILSFLIKNRAEKFIIAHNHLTNDAEPSLSDLEFYEKLKEKIFVLGLKIIDNIIVSQNNSFSFYNMNLL